MTDVGDYMQHVEYDDLYMDVITLEELDNVNYLLKFGQVLYCCIKTIKDGNHPFNANRVQFLVIENLQSLWDPLDGNTERVNKQFLKRMSQIRCYPSVSNVIEELSGSDGQLDERNDKCVLLLMTQTMNQLVKQNRM